MFKHGKEEAKKEEKDKDDRKDKKEERKKEKERQRTEKKAEKEDRKRAVTTNPIKSAPKGMMGYLVFSVILYSWVIQ